MLPLAGEFAVTANQDDHTLSVIPIGSALVATTVQLDVAPSAISAAPNSDTVLVADGSASTHSLAVASLNASSQSGTIDVGGRADELAAPAPTDVNGPLLVISDADDTIRSVDPTTQEVGAPLKLGVGPHAVSVGRGGAMFPTQVYVANAGDGTISVLDARATSVQSTLKVGGHPVGVVRTVDGRVWVADGDAGTVSVFDDTTGRTLQSINVGPHLTGLAATPDGHYLALSSRDPENALYAVDLLASVIGQADQVVRHLKVDSGVLALATGAEIARAYATTGDGHLLYWDLQSNSISQTIGVGRNPVGLALGLVEPGGGAIVTGGGGTIADTTGGAGGAAGAGGTAASAGGAAASAGGTTATGGATTAATTPGGAVSSPGGTTTSPAGGTGAPGTGTGTDTGAAPGGAGIGAGTTTGTSTSGTTGASTGTGGTGATGGAGTTGGTTTSPAGASTTTGGTTSPSVGTTSPGGATTTSPGTGTTTGPATTTSPGAGTTGANNTGVVSTAGGAGTTGTGTGGPAQSTISTGGGGGTTGGPAGVNGGGNNTAPGAGTP
jgi:YVTN family beta-propeller protein